MEFLTYHFRSFSRCNHRDSDTLDFHPLQDNFRHFRRHLPCKYLLKQNRFGISVSKNVRMLKCCLNTLHSRYRILYPQTYHYLQIWKQSLIAKDKDSKGRTTSSPFQPFHKFCISLNLSTNHFHSFHISWIGNTMSHFNFYIMKEQSCHVHIDLWLRFGSTKEWQILDVYILNDLDCFDASAACSWWHTYTLTIVFSLNQQKQYIHTIKSLWCLYILLMKS